MVRIYYHIYAIDGVESIIDEQLQLIKTFFDFPYILNVGISIANENTSIDSILEKIKPYLRDVRGKGTEWTTLDLIEKDKDKFGDLDYILYIHTKGASKINNSNYLNIESWRHVMNYFNIEKHKNVFNLFEKTSYNTYGILLGSAGKWKLYSGNFWWTKASYLKTIAINNIQKTRFDAEVNYIQNGKDWKPYSPYDRENENHYLINFKRKEYAK
jgi:hypothetical protein